MRAVNGIMRKLRLILYLRMPSWPFGGFTTPLLNRCILFQEGCNPANERENVRKSLNTEGSNGPEFCADEYRLLYDNIGMVNCFNW